MIAVRNSLFAAVGVLVVAASAACGEVQDAGAGPLPAVVLGPDASIDELPTATDLITNSYVVARGQFVGGPTVVRSSPEGEELASQLVVWEFVPDEVFRDVRREESAARVAETRRGSILVAARVHQVGVMRGEQPIEEFLRSFPSIYNFNGLPLDQSLYLFLRPGAMPIELVERDPELANVMGITEYTQCYRVEDLGRSCAYIADIAGGEPKAELEEQLFVPSDLTEETIKRAGSTIEVVDFSGEAGGDPDINTDQYVVIPNPDGGEG